MVAGDLYHAWGPRAVVAAGGAAMATGVAALGTIARPWQLYPAFLVMALGWGTMSGAAINIIVAPWFQRRRGLAVSLAFNGATLGGVIVAPALILLTERLGFAPALAVAALASLVTLLALATSVMRRGPATLGLGPDGDPGSSERAEASPDGDHRREGCGPDVALLERVGAVRARPRRAGRRAHAPRRARDAGARRGRRGARRERDDGVGADRAARDGCRRRPREPTPRLERDAHRPGRRVGLLAWAPATAAVYTGWSRSYGAGPSDDERIERSSRPCDARIRPRPREWSPATPDRSRSPSFRRCSRDTAWPGPSCVRSCAPAEGGAASVRADLASGPGCSRRARPAGAGPL